MSDEAGRGQPDLDQATIINATRALKIRRWMMFAGVVAGIFLVIVNALQFMRTSSSDWLDVGLIVVWVFVVISGSIGYILLTVRITRLEKSLPDAI
jgi:uncharacterized membrane protein